MVGIEGLGLSGDGLGMEFGLLLNVCSDYLNADWHHHHLNYFFHVLIYDQFKIV